MVYKSKAIQSQPFVYDLFPPTPYPFFSPFPYPSIPYYEILW